jgi:hypothetical protein
MEFMILFAERAGAPAPEPRDLEAMREFAGDLRSRGTVRRGGRLAPDSAGARVRVRDGRAFVSDGPFAESKEVLGGFWIVDVADREEAIDIAGRCPHARHGIVLVHAVQFRDVVADPGKGTPFLFGFGVEPGLTDPDGAKLREMLDFGDTLKRDQKFIETAPLTGEPKPARTEMRGGRLLVTDGPFAEAKEAIGGYSLVRVANRAEAIEIAKIYPHARWGSVEVREIVFFDPQ